MMKRTIYVIEFSCAQLRRFAYYMWIGYFFQKKKTGQILIAKSIDTRTPIISY